MRTSNKPSSVSWERVYGRFYLAHTRQIMTDDKSLQGLFKNELNAIADSWRYSL